ncbi:penicillin-binding protein [Acrocarpospora phusangensis]|uniref:Penicillin-binding protein n=1 Tax=Acrocarpospora phusangensis TaxID=1070424 RepID=A0A919ULL9_9ACTN|nr:penicillin-binding transpeptidase domain-containing protein [Acrocarpospora phusangensis]GIH26119.1 penicillin-binding protein [Acrocarpospora phusangensis]
MRRRPLLVLISVALAIFIFGVTGLIMSSRSDPGAGETIATPTVSPSAPSVPTEDARVDEEGDTPLETGTAYLRAWAAGDMDAMTRLLIEVPPEFATLHREFRTAVGAESIQLTPGEPSPTGENTVELPFTGVWRLKGDDEIVYPSVLLLLKSGTLWRVDWLPEVLHHRLKFGGHVVRRTVPGQAPRLATREGEPLPLDSGAEPYVADLVAGAHPGEAGWIAEIQNPGEAPVELIREEGDGPAPRVTTTIDRYIQMSAARALDGVAQPAALVAVRPSTGEVLAVADRLGGKGAFQQKFPPGSTFKIVTAAAVLGTGLTADTEVACPARYQIPNGRPILNYQGRDHGTITFRQAFAQSCNTTFARLAVERLTADTLTAEASRFGFGAELATGAGGTCGSLTPPQNDDAMAEDSFGQGTVEASPLCMAVLAAAVQNGTWHSPYLLPVNQIRDPQPQSRELPADVAAALRTMMAAVVTEGTAVNGGLPAGVAGKTGTAEVGQGRPDHAWFVGYRDDLAFAVFVENGGTGAGAAVPVAARFLNAL